MLSEGPDKRAFRRNQENPTILFRSLSHGRAYNAIFLQQELDFLFASRRTEGDWHDNQHRHHSAPDGVELISP